MQHVEKTVSVKAFTGSDDKERVHKNAVKSAEIQLAAFFRGT